MNDATLETLCRDLSREFDRDERGPGVAKLLAAYAATAEDWCSHESHREAGYTRNLVYNAPDQSLSLYVIVWLPGQWTPVHDHGSWGVVGVLEGVLEERSYVRLSADRGADEGIDLARGGAVLLGRGSVTSFVPNPDHIHVTGVPDDRPRAVSLHLYGRTMSDFNLYDVPGRTRRRIQVAHNES